MSEKEIDLDHYVYSNVRPDGTVWLKIIHTPTGLTVTDEGPDREILEMRMRHTLKVKIEERNARVKILTEI